MTLPAVPVPGVDLVPDGWCESTVIPWADAQDETEQVANGAAVVSGLIAAYRTLNQDTLELTKARRYLEVRWGELLGPGKEVKTAPGRNASHASEVSKDDRHRFRRLAENRELVVEKIRSAEDADELSRASLLRTAHVSHNGGENEWYTPLTYTSAACDVMGGIDLDPASSTSANELIEAEHIFTVEDDGLTHDWWGRIWMNPPYAQPLIARFCEKLVDEYEGGNVTQACVLVNNATETAWWQLLHESASAVAFLKGRVKFWHPDRNSATPLQGQTVLYFGPEDLAFRSAFAQFGGVR